MSGFENTIVFSSGEKLSPSSSDDILRMQKTSTDVSRINHTGNPEGVVSANPSSLSHDPVSGDVYLKQTGTGNTGWILISTSATDLHAARFIVSAGGEVDGANYTTIAAAYAAAVSAGGKQTVFIQPGTYTENITLAAGVNIAAFQADALTPNVIINGKLTATFVGVVSLSGLCLQTNSDFALAVTGSSATDIELKGCFVYALNNTAISFTSSSGSSKINIRDCKGDIATTGITFFAHSGAGSLTFINGFFENNGETTTASTGSGAASGIGLVGSHIEFPVTVSGTCVFTAHLSTLYSPIIINSTVALCLINSCYVAGGAGSAISIGAGATLKLYLCSIDSTNTNAITGAGTLVYGGITFSNSSSTINTSTQTPQPFDTAQGGTGSSSPATAGTLLIGDGTAFVPTTATFPATAGASGDVLTSDGTNWSSQPASGGGFTPVNWAVQLSANQSNVTGNNTQYQIPYDSVLFDSASGYNVGTSLYTVPITGVYNITVNNFIFGGSVASTLFFGWLSVNGAAYPGLRLFDANPASLGLSANSEFISAASYPIQLTAGDTIAVFIDVIGGISNDVGAGGGASAGCRFSGIRVA